MNATASTSTSLTVRERAARGKAARTTTPLEAHAEFRRRDSVDFEGFCRN